MNILKTAQRILRRKESLPSHARVLTREEQWLCAHCPARTHGMCEIHYPIGCADRDIVDGEVYCGIYRHVVPYDKNGVMIEEIPNADTL